MSNVVMLRDLSVIHVCQYTENKSMVIKMRLQRVRQIFLHCVVEANDPLLCPVQHAKLIATSRLTVFFCSDYYWRQPSGRRRQNNSASSMSLITFRTRSLRFGGINIGMLCICLSVTSSRECFTGTFAGLTSFTDHAITSDCNKHR